MKSLQVNYINFARTGFREICSQTAQIDEKLALFQGLILLLGPSYDLNATKMNFDIV